MTVDKFVVSPPDCTRSAGEFLCPDLLDDVARSMLAFASSNFASTHCIPGTAETVGQHGWTSGLSTHRVGIKRLCCCGAIVATVEVSPRGARFSFERTAIGGEPGPDSRRRLELRVAPGSFVTAVVALSLGRSCDSSRSTVAGLRRVTARRERADRNAAGALTRTARLV